MRLDHLLSKEKVPYGTCPSFSFESSSLSLDRDTRTLKTEDINKTSNFYNHVIRRVFLEYQNARSRYEGRTVDALALGADEGRDEQRYASGSSKYALIRGFPNGGTHHP